MDKDPFKEYIKESEPDTRDKGYAWHTAIGLQAVDGLKASDYLLQTARRNIAGEITFAEAEALLENYYEENPALGAADRTEEADKVSARMAALLSERSFSFTPKEYLAIHRKLFTGIYDHAGRIRDYNITKREWVLNGATVLYGSAAELRATLDYDFAQEKNFSYRNLSLTEIIRHLAVFVSRLWQIHVFGEGNTRTTAVFFIKYLRRLGFEATNDIFAENAWYFRNALVRANYNDLKNGIHETTEYLEIFLRNLLLNENHPLHNRAMHISGKFKVPEKVDIDESKADIDPEKVDIDGAKVYIDPEKADINEVKVDIGLGKVDIGEAKVDIGEGFQPKTVSHILRLWVVFGEQKIFGRSEMMQHIPVKASRASALLREMAAQGIIEPVSGHGKGKYRFCRQGAAGH